MHRCSARPAGPARRLPAVPPKLASTWVLASAWVLLELSTSLRDFSLCMRRSWRSCSLVRSCFRSAPHGLLLWRAYPDPSRFD